MSNYKKQMMRGNPNNPDHIPAMYTTQHTYPHEENHECAYYGCAPIPIGLLSDDETIIINGCKPEDCGKCGINRDECGAIPLIRDGAKAQILKYQQYEEILKLEKAQKDMCIEDLKSQLKELENDYESLNIGMTSLFREMVSERAIAIEQAKKETIKEILNEIIIMLSDLQRERKINFSTFEPNHSKRREKEEEHYLKGIQDAIDIFVKRLRR